MSDLVSRQSVIDALIEGFKRSPTIAIRAKDMIEQLPSDNTSETPNSSDTDTISRQAAIDEALMFLVEYCGAAFDEYMQNELYQRLILLPSAQPERTCVNCGRTVNNGGWYADGKTRCPIEEHYALPKDGYCHLWEKRNVTDDDYPERREE